MSAESISRELSRIRTQIYRGIRSGLVSEGEAIMDRSKAEFVPKDEGTLADSGQVTVLEDGGPGNLDGLSIVLSYGDEKTSDYALTVHETPGGYDPPTWRGKEVQFTTGGPKYLEKPLFEAESGMIDRIAEKVRL